MFEFKFFFIRIVKMWKIFNDFKKKNFFDLKQTFL